MQQRDVVRKLVDLEQDGTCLLCDYPLLLGYHLHHVIAADEKGPNHPLNLVGLCANHHTVLECVRRHIAPKETQGSNAWLQRAQAALKILEALPEEKQSLFNQLAEPHPLRREIRDGVESRFRTALARDIAKADAALLLRINRARPRIVLLWRIKHGDVAEPKTDAEYENSAAAVSKTLCLNDFRDVVATHLSALGLPFNAAWLVHETTY